jgi:TPR repeat protein
VVVLAIAAAHHAAAASRVPGTLRDRLYLGGSLANGRSARKDRIGFHVHDLACRMGDARSCTHLGRIHDEGWLGWKDMSLANDFYARGCRGGDGMGCFYLGLSYELADGVPHDASVAAVLYEVACAAREEFGCFRAGALYHWGEGVSPDPDRALGFFALGCEGGSPRSCTMMGAHHEPRDRATAVSFYRSACRYGDELGCDALRRLDEVL